MIIIEVRHSQHWDLYVRDHLVELVNVMYVRIFWATALLAPQPKHIYAVVTSACKSTTHGLDFSVA